MALRLSRSGWFYGASALVGVAITYGASIESDLSRAVAAGALWGVFVGASLAAFVDSLANLSEYKWNAVGWLVVAIVYGYWVTFQYEGDPELPLRESVYWRVLGWSLASLILGYALLGSFLSAKLGQTESARSN